MALAATVRADPDRDVLLIHVARGVIAAEGFKTGELSIAIVGARRMADLHWRFMNIAGPTDVLTFDLGTDRKRGALWGEIVVCQDVARARAARRTRAGLHRELALYVTHGILHLAGYDDHQPDDFERMHAREDLLLQELGVGPVFRRAAAGSGQLRNS